MPQELLAFLQRWAPNRLISRFVGWAMRCPIPYSLRRFVLGVFVRAFKIDMSVAEFPIADYPSMDALFTRRLKLGLRPIQGDWVHPADGVLAANGRISNNEAFQIKGWNYSLNKLLGEQHYKFENGFFLNYYLCPSDYHRVHSPVSGEVESIRHLQGQLWPVNQFGVRWIPELFCLNERVVLNYATARGDVAVILVGATNVGNIEIAAAPELRTNMPRLHEPFFRRFAPPIPVKAGDEIGAFHLGSTVVVLVGPEFARELPADLRQGPVRVGEAVRSGFSIPR